MATAQPKLRDELAKIKIATPAVPVISNVTAQAHEADISARLVEQVCPCPLGGIHAVCWPKALPGSLNSAPARR
jgi:hypothetical protein